MTIAKGREKVRKVKTKRNEDNKGKGKRERDKRREEPKDKGKYGLKPTIVQHSSSTLAYFDAIFYAMASCVLTLQTLLFQSVVYYQLLPLMTTGKRMKDKGKGKTKETKVR